MSNVYTWIYLLNNVYTWLIKVHTHCNGTYIYIHQVYTFQILYINFCTCNIQGQTMYTLVYTMYMSLCLEYIISWQHQSELFFNMQTISGQIGSCQEVSRHHDDYIKNCKNIAIIQLFKYPCKAVHPFQVKVKSGKSHAVSFLGVSW